MEIETKTLVVITIESRKVELTLNATTALAIWLVYAYHTAQYPLGAKPLKLENEGNEYIFRVKGKGKEYPGEKTFSLSLEDIELLSEHVDNIATNIREMFSVPGLNEWSTEDGFWSVRDFKDPPVCMYVSNRTNKSVCGIALYVTASTEFTYGIFGDGTSIENNYTFNNWQTAIKV